ncbi:diacylglycerol kinase catalytic domain-containing protein [Phlyctema vagabunda]|uniref:Diacylglycerol kinase catalytic domain-containing protein n=1 Tax=Phlyctema vagabunda TaxID=108571 RepID=A0ABR4P997_9HELO
MATNQPPPSSSSDTTYTSSDSDAESNATSVHDSTSIRYDDGELSWTTGVDGDAGLSESHLKDEEIITATKLGHGGGYQVLSILPPETSLNKQPFELRTTTFPHLPQPFLDLHSFEHLPLWLDPADGKDIHILISTLSGTGLAPDFYEAILPPLLKVVGLDGSQIKVTRTESAESVKKFAQTVLLPRANEGHKQTVLMLSGDGGMVDTLNGLLESGERSSIYVKPVLSQLPLGTGNALFHSLHQPLTPLISSPYIQGLRTLLHGTPKPLPILSATFSPGARVLSNEGQTASPVLNNTLYGAVVASYGLHATLVADSDTTAYRKHGRDRFGIAANNLLFPEGGALPHAYRADVEIIQGDTKTTIPRETHGYVLATLVSNLEKGFTISPDSKPLDGQLRLVHFGSTSGAQAMEVMKAAYGNGKHLGMEWEGEEGFEEQGKTMKLGYEALDGIRISFKEAGEDWKWRRCCIDGLIVGVEEGGWIEVRKVPAGQECVDVVTD